MTSSVWPAVPLILPLIGALAPLIGTLIPLVMPLIPWSLIPRVVVVPGSVRSGKRPVVPRISVLGSHDERDLICPDSAVRIELSSCYIGPNASVFLRLNHIDELPLRIGVALKLVQVASEGIGGFFDVAVIHHMTNACGFLSNWIVILTMAHPTCPPGDFVAKFVERGNDRIVPAWLDIVDGESTLVSGISGMTDRQPIELQKNQGRDLPTLLVVDDHEAHRTLLGLLAERLNVRVVTVSSCPEAIQALKECSFDLILMDYRMAEVDGLICTRLIRRMNEERRQIPIIAVTACVLTVDRDTCLEAGMDDYLSKPFTFEQLNEKVSYWLRRKHGAPV